MQKHFLTHNHHHVIPLDHTQKIQIVIHFRQAIEACKKEDVILRSVPSFFHNSDGASPPGFVKASINKLVKKSHKKIMCFIVRWLHYAFYLMHDDEFLFGIVTNFNFQTFPEVQIILEELEFKLDYNAPQIHMMAVIFAGIWWFSFFIQNEWWIYSESGYKNQWSDLIIACCHQKTWVNLTRNHVSQIR